MADGSSRPIGRVRVGDRVLAADPATGETGAEPVTAVITGSEQKNLVDVSVRGADGSVGSVTATGGHPFWVDADGRAATLGGRWVDAKDLKRGDWVKTADGHLARVTGTHAHRQRATVNNLTVHRLHTYHVLAGDTPVLVHNSCGGLPDDIKALSEANITGSGDTVLGHYPGCKAKAKAKVRASTILVTRGTA